jgi:hypothetical protein
LWIGIFSSWVLAAASLVADLLLSALLPIPSRLYRPVFEQRIAQIRASGQKDQAELLQWILRSS